MEKKTMQNLLKLNEMDSNRIATCLNGAKEMLQKRNAKWRTLSTYVEVLKVDGNTTIGKCSPFIHKLLG